MFTRSVGIDVKDKLVDKFAMLTLEPLFKTVHWPIGIPMSVVDR